MSEPYVNHVHLTLDGAVAGPLMSMMRWRPEPAQHNQLLGAHRCPDCSAPRVDGVFGQPATPPDTARPEPDRSES